MSRQVRRDSNEDILDLTPIEGEIITLKAVLDMIGDMVNYEMMDIHGSTPDCSIMFRTATHMAFFNIVLVDFLSKPSDFFSDGGNYINRLKDICSMPCLGETHDIVDLSEAVCAFASWLSEEVEIQDRWFPSLELQINFKIERQLFISICGNLAKHNFTRLRREAKRLRQAFLENGEFISLEKCIIALQDFRRQFYDDVFHYHSSTIVQFLNNIRWGIFSYTAATRARCVENSYDEKLRLNRWIYSYPKDVTTDIGKTCFWNLMDEARRPPFIQRFEVAKYLQARY